MKMRCIVTLRVLTAIAVLVLSACPNPANGGDNPINEVPGTKEAHLQMLRNLGVNINPDLPKAPNGASYNPQTSSANARFARSVDGGQEVLGPLGKTFSRPKREIFVAGYSINGKNHALYEDYSNLPSSLEILGQSVANDTAWAGGQTVRINPSPQT